MNQFVRRVVDLCSRRGFFLIQQSAGQILIPTYGHLGTAMRRSIPAEWWQSLVGVNQNMFGLECAMSSNGLTESAMPLSSLRFDLMTDVFKLLSCMPQLLESHQLPFGIAQIGKIFRTDESFGPFRFSEMDAMTLVYFCGPEDASRTLSHLERTRLQWWKQYSYDKRLFSVGDRSCDTIYPRPVNHRAVVYHFPWGEDEVEQIVHIDHQSLEHYQPNIKTALRSDTIPHCIVLTSTVDKVFLTMLLDGYKETQRFTREGALIRQKVCYFHPRLAPYKAAVLPAVGDVAEFCKLAEKLTDELRQAGLAVTYDNNGDLEDRFVRQDEIGTPFCIVIDESTVKKGICQLRSRDTTQAELLEFNDVRVTLQYYLKAN
ncbi:DNA polymerase subunit gamma-2, mitochondrial-like [Corticium candelabrum]|uniref:DNA polymerase subunit gamma-2, mitochondrial-like n=1 Tax=Corticium candelabrum TaxID=121492 RepID=UPI002E2F729F|nr:DNA polymerase subunit gamma-2, mitochondrial-like [Corticium candelabrum]